MGLCADRPQVLSAGLWCLMDFHDTPVEAAFRAEVCAFIEHECPAGIKRRGFRAAFGGGGWDDIRMSREEYFARNGAWVKKLAEHGWIAPAWPKEYGGAGMTVMEQFIFSQEMSLSGAPRGGNFGIGTGWAGPTIILYGTDEQKKQYLPGIVQGDDVWCQGFSEPGAGSDLASVQTGAIKDGDDYVVNGQKIWTSGAHVAKYMILLARSDPDAPKHKGISYFILDMKLPGITIRPLVNMADNHDFNEVFFDNVRVPAKNMIGEENRGWYVGMTLLDFERSGIGTTASQKRTLEKLTATLKDGPEWKRDKYRTKLADYVVANNVGRYLGLRVASMQSKGLVPNYESSVIKIYQSELGQRIYNFGVNLLGLSGQMVPEESRAPLGGDFPESYLQSVPSTIYSGTNEIQRNVIATRGLGLPRG